MFSELEMMKTPKPHRHVIKLLGCVTESGNEKILNDFLTVKNVNSPSTNGSNLTMLAQHPNWFDLLQRTKLYMYEFLASNSTEAK